MAITTAMASSFKTECLRALHNFSANTSPLPFIYRVALFKTTATLGASTTAYPTASPNHESSVGGGGTGYTALGERLTPVTPSLDSTTAITDFADVTWTLAGASATLTAAGCLIWQDRTAASPQTRRAVSSHSFTEATASGDGATFQLQFPAAAAATAILRFA